MCSSIDPMLPLVGKIAEELGKSAVSKAFEDTPKSPIEEAFEARMVDVIAQSELSDVVQQIEGARRLLGIRRALNARSAMDAAIALAKKIPEENKREQDLDWFSQWFESVQHVSDEMVQSVWAQAYAQNSTCKERVLSLRALDTLRLMDRESILFFCRVGRALAQLGSVFAVDRSVMNAFVSQDGWEILVDLQLVSYEETLATVIYLPGTYALRFDTPEGRTLGPVKSYILTARGKELVGALPTELDTDYPTDHGIDSETDGFVPRYINVLARAFSTYERGLVSLTLERRRSDARGRSEAAPGMPRVWNFETLQWIKSDEPAQALPECDEALLLSGLTGVPELDSVAR